MSCGVEHDAYAVPIPIGWLPRCLGAAKVDGAFDRGIEVVDRTSKWSIFVSARLLGPRRRPIASIALELVAAIVALVANGPGTALLVVGATIIVQQVEGNVLQPLMLERAVRLHRW